MLHFTFYILHFTFYILHFTFAPVQPLMGPAKKLYNLGPSVEHVLFKGLAVTLRMVESGFQTYSQA